MAFIQALAELLRENDLTELEVKREYGEDDSLNVRVSRQPPPQVVTPLLPRQPRHGSGRTRCAGPGHGPRRPFRVEDPAQHPGAVTSPMVGTAYLPPEPGAAPFVKVGDKVTEGQTLLIIEAMKTMNHIPAPRAGTVKRILVEDGAPVEYGAPLMIIE